MDIWNLYKIRVDGDNSKEDPDRTKSLDNIQSRMRRQIAASLSYHKVKIGNEEKDLAIVDTKDFYSKKIFSMPGESLTLGKVIDWLDNKWLITEVNPQNEFCSEGKIIMCNYQLKWLDDFENVVSKWCVIADSTKYSVGEEDKKVITIGDTRLSVLISKDADTIKLKRGKRFLIDDPDSTTTLAYEITNPNKIYNLYKGHGVYKFILNEVNVTDNDNVEARIADYYKVPKNKKKKNQPSKSKKSDKPIEDAKQKKDSAAETKTKKKDVWI